MTSPCWSRMMEIAMARLVQVTDVEEALTYWKNGMLMCRGGESKWQDYSAWSNDSDLRSMVRAGLGNVFGGCILVEDDECDSTAPVSGASDG